MCLSIGAAVYVLWPFDDVKEQITLSPDDFRLP
jgi:hypothetical protein